MKNVPRDMMRVETEQRHLQMLHTVPPLAKTSAEHKPAAEAFLKNSIGAKPAADLVLDFIFLGFELVP